MSSSGSYRYDASAYRALVEQHFTYANGFARNVHRYGRRPALHDPAGGRRWTYAQLGADVERLAAGLARSGVVEDDVVVFQLYNGPELVLLWLACQRLGAVACPVNFRLAAGETAHVLDDSAPRVYVYDHALEDVARAALRLAEHAPEVVAVVGGEDGERDDAGAAVPFTTMSDTTDDAPPAPERSAFAESTRLYTSGTTGLPKGVSLNSMVEVLSAHDVAMHFPLSPQDKTINMTPWFHRGGLYAGGPNPALYVGAEVVALAAFDAATVLDLVAAEGVTFLIGAPTNLERLAAEQARAPRELGSLRGIVTMGAPLDREACLRYQRVLTPRIFNGYGTTEAFWNTFLRPDDLPEHAGSAGRACTDDDVVVVKVLDDRDADPGDPGDLVARDGAEIGEVAVRSVKSGLAYVNNAREQAAKFRPGGWLVIGDLATWDEDEYVTIVGRKNDMIVSGGENVHPVQVEAVLLEHEGVADAAVVGLPDADWGEVVVAYVVPVAPDGLTPEACDAHCRSHPMLAAYKRPRAYRFVDALPMTATGKKLHYKLRERASEDDAAGLLVRVDPAARA